jgi:8-oxo-dGTP pyrophosphatase MutT (NUDIX family)
MNKDYPNKFWAGGFLYNPIDRTVFLHLRDGNTKFNPNSWAFFGGLNEGDETPVQCFIRELEEEIGLKVTENDVKYLDDYLNVELDTYRCIFYVISNLEKTAFNLGEGAGFDWVKLSKLDSVKLTEKTERDLKTFVNANS